MQSLTTNLTNLTSCQGPVLSSAVHNRFFKPKFVADLQKCTLCALRRCLSARATHYARHSASVCTHVASVLCQRNRRTDRSCSCTRLSVERQHVHVQRSALKEFNGSQIYYARIMYFITQQRLCEKNSYRSQTDRSTDRRTTEHSLLLAQFI
jgi:hypothetical protein